jgi:hypothetical protein
MTKRTHSRVVAELGLALAVLLPWAPSAGAQARAAEGAVTATLYADGSVACDGADDLSSPSGSVTLRPVANGVEFQVALTGAASSWDYYVELSQGGVCQLAQQFHGLTTDGAGDGWLKGVYDVVPGTRELLVAVVSDPPNAVPPDPRDRELAPATTLVVEVGGAVGGLLTLGFEGAPDGGLPWSEQDFTFSGWSSSVVQSESLRVTSWGGTWGTEIASLSRDDGGIFDAVSLRVLDLHLIDGDVSVETGFGGYEPIDAPGTVTLSGPEWRGVTELWVVVYGYGDGGGLAASVTTDDFVVRVPPGDRYCSWTLNSTGDVARIGATGTSSLSANDIVLRADGVPDQPFLFFHAANRIAVPFGNGLRCAGGDVVRLPAGLAVGNMATTVLDLPSAGITAPGERHFQCWFRDPAAGGAGFDTSDALTIDFVP